MGKNKKRKLPKNWQTLIDFQVAHLFGGQLACNFGRCTKDAFYVFRNKKCGTFDGYCRNCGERKMEKEKPE